MQPLQHQMMGYDRAITMFSPDGRLLQVEYARKTVRQGNTAIGLVCKDGVLLVTDKRVLNPLMITEAVEKMWQIDDHIGATASGFLSDARILIERAQVKAQQNKVTYDSPVDILTIVKDLCTLKQTTTQYGGLRPFGVALIIAGVDDGVPVVYETDPMGNYFQYKAAVIGEAEEEVEAILNKEYKETLTIEEGLKLLIKTLKKVLGEEFSSERIDAAYIKVDEAKFTKIKKSKIDRVVKEK
ncbi:proteasome endopeptidase complex, archaeal, alpha subunit [Candidatus Woesearchaeota archaeon]|nr:MAG: proteasome endopeptidase complex, archaeal, alpha subunit [Candidatus Woesearchaeota archaeon]